MRGAMRGRPGKESARHAELWPAVLAESADAIWLLDAQERVVGWSGGAEDLLGYRADEILGEPIGRLIPPDLRREREDHGLAQVLSERGAITDYETRRLRKDGTEVEVRLSRTWIRTGTGEAVGSVTVARDLSERRRVERQIIESEKLASVGQVAASVAQEIGAPITALGLLVEQMRRDPEVVERYEDEIRTIQDLLDRVSRLSRQLVDLAKPGEPRMRKVDAVDLVRDTLALLAPALERGRIRLETDLDERRPPIQADPRQIEQVIVNLVLNAQRALAGRRQPRIRVSAGAAGGLPSAGTSKRRALEIRVADNGPGIEPEDLPHIFTPFFSRFGGSGLGLPVARQLLDRHGGTLHVESEPGHGATFIIHLPLDT